MSAGAAIEPVGGWDRWGHRAPDPPATTEVRPGEQAPPGMAWRRMARPEQLAPAGGWTVWLVLAGRGFGKTRAGAEWVRAMARAHPGARIGLVGASTADVRNIMVMGESGIVRLAASEGEAVVWRETHGRLDWANGSTAQAVSAVDVDAVRGHQFHFAWCDELAFWPDAAGVWGNLRMALRLGELPRAVVTTTPRPLPLLKRWLDDPSVAVTRGGTRDNAENLPAGFVERLEADYAGTATGAQELLGEIVEAVPGALWTLDGIVRGRPVGAMRRVVVAVDPPAGGGTCGVIVAGLDAGGVVWVLDDRSVTGAEPDRWAAAVATACAAHGADLVVVETNQGGRMAEQVLRLADPTMPVRPVRAQVGKVRRAEPVAMLYARGLVRHAGVFGPLEAQMCAAVAGGRFVGASPDRLDALVWAVGELALAGAARAPSVRAM